MEENKLRALGITINTVIKITEIWVCGVNVGHLQIPFKGCKVASGLIEINE